MYDNYNKIAIGTAQYGAFYGIANTHGKADQKQVDSILELASVNGISTLDTAKTYGSEKIIGNYLKSHPYSFWDIITKINHIDEKIIYQLQNSTNELTVKPKYLLAHSAQLYCNQKFINQIHELKNTGKIRKVGVSLYTEKELVKVLESDLIPDVVQIPMNILDTRLYRKNYLSKLNDKNIDIHIRSVFLQGLFYLQYTKMKSYFNDVKPYLDMLRNYAAEVNLTVPELSLLWILSLREVKKVIIGVENVNQLTMHLKSMDKKIDTSIFEKAILLNYENNKILNPSLWP